MTSIPTSCPPVNAKAQMQFAIRERQKPPCIRRLRSGYLESLLAVVCYVLSRPYHRRRRALPIWVVPEGVCSRCKRHQELAVQSQWLSATAAVELLGLISYKELPRVRRQGSGSARCRVRQGRFALTSASAMTSMSKSNAGVSCV